MRRATKVWLGMALGVLLAAYPCLADQQEQALQKGVKWLTETQNPEGGFWGTETDFFSKNFHITCEAADTFYYLGTSDVSYSKAIQWIDNQQTPSCRALSQKTKSLAEYGSDTTELIGTLTSSQNEDGGFGVSQGYESDNLDTTLGLSALKSANYSDTRVIENVVLYLLSQQNRDGGWNIGRRDGGEGSSVYVTSLVLLVLENYREQYNLHSRLYDGAV